MSDEFISGCSMRSSDRLIHRCTYLAIACLLCFSSAAGAWMSLSSAADPTRLDSLTVNTDAGGGVRATATVVFPAKLEVLQAILTDYPHWPELFETRMRMARIERHGDRTLTEIVIDHALLPGERRLLSESYTPSEGGLVTDLRGGDFRRYHRVWKLISEAGGSQTRAEFELIVDIDTILPDWLVALAMRRELEAHFRIVREKALRMVRLGS